MVAFFFGQYAARGRWGTGDDQRSSTGRFRVDLRPIRVGMHVLLLTAAVAAWTLVLGVPVSLDARGDLVLSDGGSAADQFWFVVTVYGVISAAIAMMVAVSLLKKLTYNRSLARHAALRISAPAPHRDGSGGSCRTSGARSWASAHSAVSRSASALWGSRCTARPSAWGCWLRAWC